MTLSTLAVAATDGQLGTPITTSAAVATPERVMPPASSAAETVDLSFIEIVSFGCH
jgi:hypothetical protein